MEALNNDYCVSSEERDWQLFIEWNDKTSAFTDYSHTDKGEPYDVVGRLKDGRKAVAELKFRNVRHDTYPTAMIEADKLADGLLYAAMSGMTPLYVNFYSDEWTSVHNLINQPNITKQQKQRRSNPGFDDKMVEHCAYHLSRKNGVYYDEGGRIHQYSV